MMCHAVVTGTNIIWRIGARYVKFSTEVDCILLCMKCYLQVSNYKYGDDSKFIVGRMCS
jgi:hypothetical protein